MKCNKKATKVLGSLLLIRHLPDDPYVDKPAHLVIQ